MPLIQDYNKLFEHTDDIKKVILNGNIVWPAAKPASGPDYTEPFYSENTTNQTESVTFKRYATFTSNNVDVYYSLDKGNSWNFCGNTSEDFTYRNPAHTKVWFKANIDTWDGIRILDCKKVGGNIMSLFYGEDFADKTVFPTSSWGYYCYEMFFNNTNLVDASSLLLPVDRLGIPSDRGGEYANMFYACTSLTKAPALPATTLGHSCYNSMFYNCHLLNSLTCLATSGIVGRNVGGLLDGVASTGTFYCAQGMTSTWQALTVIPEGWTIVEV